MCEPLNCATCKVVTRTDNTVHLKMTPKNTKENGWQKFLFPSMNNQKKITKICFSSRLEKPEKFPES